MRGLKTPAIEPQNFAMTLVSEQAGVEESTNLRALVQRIKDLPTIPSVLMKLISLSAESTTNADSLSEIISMDQTISAKLLRLSNSAFYGCRGQVSSVSRAIMVLGFNEVKSLALGMSVFNAFSEKKEASGSMSIEKLWKHSMATAAVSRFLTKQIGGKGDSAFTGGLLHDIGKVVFLSSFQEEYKNASAIVAETGCSISDAEEKVFHANHVTIGEWLTRKWKMPEEIIQCVKYHPNPKGAGEEHARLVSIVHLSNLATRKLFVGYGGDPLILEPEEGALEKAGLGGKGLEKAEAFLEEQRDGIEQMI